MVMLGDLKRLGQETMVYGLSAVVGRLLNFILTPFYTHFLRPDDLGVVTTAFVYIAFLNIFYQHGMDQAYLRYASSGELGDRRENFSTAMGQLVLTAIGLSVLLMPSGDFMAKAIGFGRHPELACYCIGILILDALAVVPFAELRLSHKPWTYVAIRSANIAVNVAMNILFLWHFRMGVHGVFLAGLIASAVSVLLLLPVMIRYWRTSMRKNLHAAMLRFALPLVPAGLTSTAVQVINRPILLHLTNEATVGIYQTGYRLGIFMMLVVNMFDAAWRPFFLERAQKPGAQEVFGRVLTYFLLAGAFVTLAVSLFIGDLVCTPLWGKPIIHPDFWAGLSVVPFILAGYLLDGAYINFMAPILLTKRTGLLLWATGAGAAVNIAANFLLIPHWGMMGAAWATLLSYAVMAACLYVLGRKLYPIPYEYDRIAHLAAAAGIVGLGLYAGSLAFPSGSTGWLLTRIAALAGLPVLLLLSGFFKDEEIQAVRRLLAGNEKRETENV